MNNAQRTIAIVGYGPAGYRLVPLFGETGIAMTVTAILLAFGVVDLSRLHREDTPLSIPGVTSISPSLAERTKAHADELLVSAYTKLANSMHQKLIDLFTAKHGGTILAIVDMTVLHEVAESLRSLMKRLPKQDMVIICPILPSDMHKTHLINEVYALLAQLQAEGVCSISLIYDPLRAPLAMHWGTDILEKALVQTMLSLCIAPMIDDSNPTISEVFNRLGAQSPFCGLSYSSAGVASGATPWLWKAWQKVAPGAGARGRGSIDDLFIQARECINRTQQDQKSLASPAMPDEDQLRFAVLNLPFAAGDTRFTEAAHSLQTYIKHTFHNSMFDVVVRSNGVAATANSVHTSSYYVGASCLYGLPLVSVIPTDDQAVTSSDNEQTGNTTLTTVVLETPVSERVNGRKRS